MTVSELVRYWIHQAMEKEGVFKKLSIDIKPKKKGGK